MSTYRGRDPRDYTLIAFGGNGPIVAAAIARELSMPRVIVPLNSGVLSAHGLLVADHEQELVKSFPGRMSELNSDGFAQAFEALAATAVLALESEGFVRSDIVIQRYADLRYVGQAFELTVPVVAAAPPDLRLMAQAFHQEHFRTYAHKADNEPVENVNIRVIAKVATPPWPVKPVVASAQPTVTTTCRDVYFGPVWGTRLTPVLQRTDLVGGSMAGPVIVEEYDATCVVPPDATVRIDGRNNLIIELEI